MHPSYIPYDPVIAKEICMKIATSHYGIKKICTLNKDKYPSYETVYRWLFETPEFSELYAKAKESQSEVMCDEMLDIADETSRDTITKTRPDGVEYEVCNSEWINRSRLRVDTRKWLMAKLRPRKYGEKSEQTHNVNVTESTKRVINAENEYEKNY